MLLTSATIIGVSFFTLSRGRRTVSVEVNRSSTLGKAVNLLGVNDGPLGPKGWDSRVYPYDLTDYYTRMGVNFIRVHDLWGAADIDVVFPNFSRDPYDENAYDFSSTDRHISMMLRVGARVIFRLGYSWSDPPKNSPPADYEKWANICLHIVKHYNEGWANGMNQAVKYWEIWNEPDIEQFWNGTVEEYFSLYNTTARRIKEHKVYYVIASLRELLESSTLARCEVKNGGQGFAAMATISEDGVHASVVISNYGKEASRYEVHISELPWGDRGFSYEVLSVDERTNLDTVASGSSSGDRFEISLDIEPYAVHILRLVRARPETP